MIRVRVEARRDPTVRLPWFAIVDPEHLGRSLLDADWRPGMWASDYRDGWAIASYAGPLPRARHDLWIRVLWFPLRRVPRSWALSRSDTIRDHGTRDRRGATRALH